MNSGNSIVELVDITHTHSDGARLFDGLNFHLKSGEMAVIYGSTGIGKTTLVELIIGKRAPQSGTVVVFGEKIDPGSERLVAKTRQKIGGVGGLFRPISYQTVYENLVYPLILRGDRTSSCRSRVTRVLSQLNLIGKKGETAGNLSRGERILLMLGRAIIADQPLLLIDEPLAGLDTQMSSEVLKLLHRLSVAGHSMMIMTTGQTDLQVPNATVHEIRDGRLG
ncbi:MAG: ABC transporter ATP-binding protein [Candidatus Zixiibacteriota bacterium]|nr:MAG: ABC transporter ATP-binding protein [candidate division Zixibacteria bacterium]